MDLQEIRKAHPEYDDFSDAALLDRLYRKFYSDMPREEFDVKIGAPPPKTTKTPKPFNVLPLTEDAEGNVSFDPNAGVLGVLKRTGSLPAEVARGEIDPTGPEGVERTLEAAATLTPMGAAARAIPSAPLSGSGAYKKPRSVPTRKELKAETDANYAEARSLGAEYPPQSVAEWSARVAGDLDARGQIAENYPRVHALLNKFKNPPYGAVSINLESLTRS